MAGSARCLQCKASLELSDEVLGYLCCDPFTPLVLKPGVEYSLGRGAQCDLTLPHHSISRHHATVSVPLDRVVFQDRSSNGSLVNGKRCKEAILSLGDTITLGPYDVVVVKEPEDPGGGTVTLDFTSRTTGLLEDEPLVQVLQGLEFNNRTGSLEVLAGRDRGYLILQDGQPWRAKFGDAEHAEAVHHMLSLQEGRFVFMPEPIAGERSMTVTITGLLFEHARREDESPPTRALER